MTAGQSARKKEKAKMIVAYICDLESHGLVLHACPDNGKTAKEMMRLHEQNFEPHGLVKESDLA